MVPWCRFRFEGAVQHVWATLIVRLAHCGVFVRDDVGEDCAVFRGVGRSLGLRLAMTDDGEATIQLLGEPKESTHAEWLLERFVDAHLARRAIPESVVQSRLLLCSSCGFQVPDALIEALRDAREFNCPQCPARISLEVARPAVSERWGAEVEDLEHVADGERFRLRARASVQGKEAISEFDAFITYNSKDVAQVEGLSDRLRDFGLNPWLDRDQIPPGRWVHDVLQEAIGKSASAVICIGVEGLGRWQSVELRTFVAECVERDIPVIPVLLPNAELPDDARFLRALEYVRFKQSLSEDEPLMRLIWGITGDRETRYVPRSAKSSSLSWP
jgi:DNA-directed RNA polymerase subunit RPC12/RpoP